MPVLLASALFGLTGCAVQDGVAAFVHGARTAFGSTGADDVSDRGNTDIYAVRAGDCVDDADVVEEEVASLEVVDCAAPHDSEVFALVALEGRAYPGDDAVFEMADEACFDHFEEWVGATYDDAEHLEYAAYTPSRAGWVYGDREATCIIFAVDGSRLTGTTKGTGAGSTELSGSLPA